jgi:hypothetical protein
MSRAKVLLESLKIGLPAVNIRFPNKDLKDTPDAEFFEVLASHDPKSVPIAQDLRRALFNAAYLRDIMEQVCRITEAEERLEREKKEAAGEPVADKQRPSIRDQIERAKRVYRWGKSRGKLIGISLEAVSWIPFETFQRYESEMLAEESSSGITPEPNPKLQGSATAVPAASPSPAPSPKSKPTRTPRKE